MPPNPTLETFENLAKAMHMTRDELISRVEGRQNGVPVNNKVGEDEEHFFMRIAK